MARFTNETAAREAGYLVEHEPERQRFVITTAGAVVGEAHYTLLPDGVIDFDHTVVIPSLRGTGLSGLLVRHALADDIVTGRKIRASCWFVAGLLEKHPELAKQ